MWVATTPPPPPDGRPRVKVCPIIKSLGRIIIQIHVIINILLANFHLNINFSNCKRKSESTIIRKEKKKCCDGISVPIDINIMKLKALPAEKLENGELAIWLYPRHTKK